MPTLKRHPELQEGERGDPLLWVHPWNVQDVVVPNELLHDVFGDTKTTRRIQMWGHEGEHQTHWLAVRGGLPMHNDVGFTRYTHQVIVRNDGWLIHGVDPTTENAPPQPRGTFVCLDTHSPHRLVRDKRLGLGLWYVALVVDMDVPLLIDEAWELLEGRLHA